MNSEQAYDEFRQRFDSDDAAARTAFSELYKQLLEVTGWGNATALQLHRLRVAVLECDNDKLKTILTEPVTECPGNVVQDTIKDLQSQVRELEIANAGLQARNDSTREYIMELEELAASTRDNAADDFLQAAADSVLTRAKAEGNMVTGQPGDLPCEPIPGLEQLG